MCGILGIILAEEVKPNGSLAAVAADGLIALQHRGTESSGLVGTNGIHRNHFEIVKGAGLVREIYSNENLSNFKDTVAVLGHNRYSTAGMKLAINCVQPFVVHTTVGLIAIAHNGELVNANRKRDEVLQSGVGLSTDTDSELIAQIIAKSVANNMNSREDESEYGDISNELAATMNSITMSYSLLVMTYDRIYAIRDPYGNRPLCVGTMFTSLTNNNGEIRKPFAFMAASESCAIQSIAEIKCEVKAGEIVELSRSGIRSIYQMDLAKPSFCIFEYVYFARADSIIEGRQIQTVREECGRILADEAFIEADIVSTVPDSASAATIGYSKQSGIRYEQVLHRNSYIGRSFIQPSTELRQKEIHKKFGVIQENVAGKRIVLIDDSIVRGNTMGKIVRMLKAHGAKEVHLRIASPPLKYPCFMGINIPSKNELLAAKLTVEEICAYLGADSVQYLSIDGLKRAVIGCIQDDTAVLQKGHCTACLSGEYPVELEW